jgi:hypothetical protein
MKRFVGPIIVAVLVGAGCWFFGLDILPSIVAGAVIAGVGITLGVVTNPGGNRDWPASPPVPNDGARRETFELAWALRTRSGIVDEPALERVRAIAASSLARRHLDLADPAHRARIERLIGAPAYALLAPDGPNSGGRLRVRLTSIIGALDVLDRL